MTCFPNHAGVIKLLVHINAYANYENCGSISGIDDTFCDLSTGVFPSVPPLFLPLADDHPSSSPQTLQSSLEEKYPTPIS